MKTPFDAAMRVRRREIDTAQVAINIQVNQLVQIEDHHNTVESTLSKESEIAAANHALSAHAYIERMRALRERLAGERAEADLALGRLRTRALAAYGDFKAIESAADAYRDDETRKIAIGEQGHLDDISATAVVRRLRRWG